MYAGLLDVFHDATDEHVLTVTHGIHIDFDGQIEKAVEQHWTVIGHLDRVRHVSAQVLLAEYDFHGAAAEHVGWTHHQRKTDLTRHLHALLLVARGSVGRLLEAQLLDEK